MRIKEEEVKKIVIIRFKAFGDILLSQPAVRAVREKYPKSRIYMLINKEAEEIMSGLDLVDEIICFDKTKSGNILRDLRLIFKIASIKPDMVIDLFGNMRSALVTFLSGAKYRAGGPWRIRKYFYNIVSGVAHIDTHISEVMLNIVKGVGAKPGSAGFGIYVDESTKKAIDALFSLHNLNGNQIIGINIFGTWYTKRWPPEKYLQLADRLLKDGFTVVLIGGGQKEIDELNKINTEKKYLILAQANIKNIAEVISRLNLVITNDGFIRHIAVGFNKKIVTIIGPTNDRAITPKYYKNNVSVTANIDCLGCEKTVCNDLKCMNSISIEQVYSATKELTKE